MANVTDYISDAESIIAESGLEECESCGTLVKSLNNGLCADCIPAGGNEKSAPQKKKRGRPPKNENPNEKSEQPPAGDKRLFAVPKGTVPLPLEEIYIHFYERDRELFEKLQQSATENRRTLDNEILYRLDQSCQPPPAGSQVLRTGTTPIVTE